jgi:hypothetical protein
MTISMYQASIPILIKTLANLAGILRKAEAHASSKKIDPDIFIQGRLYPDMFPLARQIQIATDVAKSCPARLSGQTPPAYEDSERTFAELQTRIAKTITFLDSFTPVQIDGTEEASITLMFGKREFTFQGLAYLLEFVLPNVYFHVTTTYAILRHWGVELGKADFLGSH